MVYGREFDGEIDEFGTSGYVYRNTFVLYDRGTNSLWYPLDDEKWTAIAGPRKGETIPFIQEPKPMMLAEWREMHPNTLVLLGDRADFERLQN